jgi:hypothetical protein
VGRWRLSMRMSCCRSCFSSSIWVFSSAFMSSSRSDSWAQTETAVSFHGIEDPGRCPYRRQCRRRAPQLAPVLPASFSICQIPTRGQASKLSVHHTVTMASITVG